MVALSRSGKWNGILTQDYLHKVKDIVPNGASGMILKDCKNVQEVFVRQNFGKMSSGLFSKPVS